MVDVGQPSLKELGNAPRKPRRGGSTVLTLRDRFAIEALHYLTPPPSDLVTLSPEVAQHIAVIVYAVADAMLAERVRAPE